MPKKGEKLTNKAKEALKKARWANRLSLDERFSIKTAPGLNGCIEWTAGKDKDGYGFLRIDGKNVRAHRFAYQMKFGEFDQNLLVCHKCDNPGCVNPDHLFLGTNTDNIKDMDLKGRRVIRRGAANHNAKIDAIDAQFIRRLVAGKEMTYTQIAAMYGITDSAVDAIIKRKTWRHV